ncbi:MAG: DNA helicase [Peptococcaceae bacterium BRH_c4a]|nr:MAG: DNA helicase [Peptococcaceae bacterium BRH_c4a]
MTDRVPPQNIDAEQWVLGALFVDRDTIYKISRFLKPEDFYLEGHRLVYRAFLELDEAGVPTDLLTVTDILRQQGSLEKVGGATYVASLAGMVPTAANAESYARIIEEKSLLRSLISMATRIAGLGYEGGDDAEKLIDEAENMLLELSSRRSSSGFTPIDRILVEIFKLIEERFRNKGKVSGVLTGFSDLDRLCCGLQSGDLIIVAGRPAMGKTSFGLTLAHQASQHHGVPTAVFSLEMAKAQLVQRVLCGEAMVDMQKVRSGNLSETDWNKMAEAAAKLTRVPLYIDDSPGISVRQIRAKSRRLKAEKGLGLIVIDYLQLIQGSSRSENRQQEIADISRSLKAMAKDLEVPVVALAQLSRSVEQRDKKRPIMSDLRESGSLEQDADIVMFIYREEYYKPDTEKKGIAEIIVAKQRNGPTGSVELAFLKEYTRFMNLSRDDYE